MIPRLAIVGVGLLGGSLAQAARARGLAREIVGVGRHPARLAAAVRDGALDRVTDDLKDGLRGADLVVLAVPVLVIEQMLPAVAAAVDERALVTDVGSTKAGIVQAAEALSSARPFRFVGSHPMAGSERAGYAAARVDLFERATVIVTPTARTSADAVKDVAALWEGVGGRVRRLDPTTHDRVVAAISHLPHLVAFALVAGVDRFEPSSFAFAAGGFRDTTRVAAADPVMWQEIFHANRDALRASLAHFRTAVGELETLVDGGDAAGLQAWIARAKALREAVA